MCASTFLILYAMAPSSLTISVLVIAVAGARLLWIAAADLRRVIVEGR